MAKPSPSKFFTAFTVSFLCLWLSLLPISKSWAGAGGPAPEPLLSAKPYIQALRNSKDPAIRVRAATELGYKIGRAEDHKATQEIYSVLIEALKEDKDPKVRSSVAYALHHRPFISSSPDKSVFTAMIDALKHDHNAEVRFSIASSLWTLDFEFSPTRGIQTEIEATMPVLMEALKTSKDAEVRQLAANALGKIGSKLELKPKRVIPVLVEALNKDLDPGVRLLIANALGEIDSEAVAITPMLMGVLKKEKTTEVRLSLINALGNFGPKAKAAVPTLASIFKNDTNPDIRFKSAYVLGKIRKEEQTVVPFLIKILKNDSELSKRKEAIELLASINSNQEAIIIGIIEALKKDKEQEIRSCAALALANFSSEPKIVVPTLLEVLKNDKNLEVRYTAVHALGGASLSSSSKTSYGFIRGYIWEEFSCGNWSYGDSDSSSAPKNFKAEAQTIVPALIEILKNDKAPNLREASASVLAKYSSEAKVIVPTLIEILKNDSNSQVRSKSAYVLSSFSSEFKIVIPALLQVLERERDEDVRSKASVSFVKISEEWQDKLDKLSNKELENAISVLEEASNIIRSPLANKFPAGVATYDSETRVKLKRTLSALQAKQASRMAESEMLAKWMQEHIWIPGLLIIPGLYFVLLSFCPRWLLLLPSSLSLPKIGKISPKIVLWIKYRPRVLDAWVQHYLGSTILTKSEQPRARIRFWELDTTSRHATYIPIALCLQANSQNARHEIIPLQEFQATFRENTVRLLIYGEGGVGKTSLACELARLAMAEKHNHRLCKQHPMIPVLIEPELIEQEIINQSPFPVETIRKGDEIIQRTWDNAVSQPLLEVIRKQLQFLINEQEPINDELLQQLLQAKRILVIVDRFSEMSQQARQVVAPVSKTHPINALIITSRQQEKLDSIKLDIAQPLQLTGSELMRFMEEYLKQTKGIELKHQPPLYQACENLQRIVEARGDRSLVTVLLAKLTAEQLIAGKPLPRNIPSLMLESLDLLNAQVKRREFKLDNRIIRRDAQVIAWTCLQSTYRPNTASLAFVEETLKKLYTKTDANQRLKYLETELRIIETIGNTHDQIRIVLDPLAEYLAGLHLIEIYGNNEHAWKAFFKRADEFEKETIQGFLLAVQDCCRVASAEQKVPTSVVDMFKLRIC